MANYIPFNKPYMSGKELSYIKEAHENLILAGDGPFSTKCSEYLEQTVGCKKALLTHSCTAALEMTSLLMDLNPGDEVIMPSYTFVSTANAFASRGAIPVFIDIREDTLNINEKLIEHAITEKTKALVAVHYAGVACEMESILDSAKRHNLFVVEDAAQGIVATYKGRPLGSMGDFGCLSFHETKNIHCGEGGALLVNNEKYVERAEIVREKGTNRAKFFRGQTDKYRWVDVGSSYLPGELTAAFLAAQLEEAENITKKRLSIWNKYHEIFEDLEMNGKVRRPIIHNECKHNGHIYYLLLDEKYDRDAVLEKLKEVGVYAVFHYQPLHSSPAGLKYGKTPYPLKSTNEISKRIVRLPMWIGFEDHERVKDAVTNILK
jgi:dTDP-4-amino-4,6-dideoxygalactose transaminase